MPISVPLLGTGCPQKTWDEFGITVGFWQDMSGCVALSSEGNAQSAGECVTLSSHISSQGPGSRQQSRVDQGVMLSWVMLSQVKVCQEGSSTAAVTLQGCLL